MAVQTITTNVNLDAVASGAWRSNDSLTINNGAIVTVNSNQEKFLSGITINNGKLRIENTSTTVPLIFRMGRASGTAAPSITPSSGLGSIEVAGNWIEIGTGDGTTGQTLTHPFGGHHVAGMWVETAAGSGVYERWANCISFIRAGGRRLHEDLQSFGAGVKGTVFKQGINPSPVYHTVQTNCTTSTASRNVTVTSTAGIFPGAQIVGSAGIAANSVVERVVNATTLEMNAVGTANSSVVTVTVYNTHECWLTNQITVGDGVHGKVIPVGAKVRVPNIMITTAYGINIGATGNGANLNLTNGGLLSVDKCLFADSHSSFTTPQTLSLQNCAFSFRQNFLKCYGLVLRNVIFSAWPQYTWLTSGRFTQQWVPQSTATSSLQNFDYITGELDGVLICNPAVYASANATTAAGALGFSYADGIIVNDLKLLNANNVWPGFTSNGGLCLQYVYRSTFTNLQIHGMANFSLYASSGNTFDGCNLSLVTLKDNVANLSSNSANFIGFDPETGLDFVDGTPYYVKLSRKSVNLESEAWWEGVEQCIVPYYSANLGSINQLGFFAGNNAVSMVWDDRRPTHTAPAFEIYRSTTAGVPVRDAGTRIFTTNTVTVLTYTDSAVTNGTRYYYVFRKYYSAGVYEDSPVWDVTPKAPPTGTNYLLQSRSFNQAQWVKSNVTVNTTADTTGVFTFTMYLSSSTRRMQVTAANGTLTNTVTGLTIAQTYTASVWVRFAGSCSNAVAAVTTTPMRLTFGTAFVDFNATNTWTQQSVSFVATATSHTFVLWFDTSGNWVDLDNCMVNLGGTVGFGMETATAAITAPVMDISTLRAENYPWSSTRNCGTYYSLPALASGVTTMYAAHMSTTRGFTPTIDNLLSPSALAFIPFKLAVTSSGNTFRNITYQGKGRYPTRTVELIGSCSDNVFESVSMDHGFSGFYATSPYSPIVYITTDSNRNEFKDWDVKNNIPNLLHTRPFFVANDANGTVVQNFRVSPSNTPIDAYNNDMIFKGCGGGNAYAADAALTWDMGSTADGVPVTFTGIYNTHFAELYHTETTGALNVFFTASTAADPPYTLTGTASFSNTGLLYLQSAGDSITYTWPHKIYGVSGFRNITHKVFQNDLAYNNTAAQGKELLQALLVEYQIDTGSGYGAWTEATPANLSAETVSPSSGFNLKLRLTARQFFNYGTQTNNFVVGETIRHVAGGGTARVVADYDMGTTGCCVIDTVVGNWTTNTAVVRNSDSQARAAITYVNTNFALGPSFNSYIRGFQIHTTVDQTALYPSNPITLTVTGLVAGSDVTFLSAGTETILTNWEDIAGTTAEYVYYTASGAVDIVVIKPGYMPAAVRNYPLAATNSSLPITQPQDPSYLE